MRGTALDIDFLIATLHHRYHSCVQENGTNEPVKELEHWQSLLELCEGYRVFAANQSLWGMWLLADACSVLPFAQEVGRFRGNVCKMLGLCRDYALRGATCSRATSGEKSAVLVQVHCFCPSHSGRLGN